MIEGHSEPRAVGVAIEELGDAASLAQRYREAFENPFRRRLMHSVLMIAAGAAVSVGTLAALRPPVSPQPQDRHAQAGQAPAVVKSPAIPPQVALPPRSEIAAGATAQVILEAIVAPMGRELLIKWDDLEQAGLSPEAKSVRPFAWTDPIEALRTVGSAFDLADQEPMRLALYDFPERPFVSTQGQVAAASRMETRTIDVEPLLRLTGQLGNAPELISVIRGAVAPVVWEGNGGDCTISAFGSTLIVRARSPIHLEIRKFLDGLTAISASQVERRPKAVVEEVRRLNATFIDLRFMQTSRSLNFRLIEFVPGEVGRIMVDGLDASVTSRIVDVLLPKGSKLVPTDKAEADRFEPINARLRVLGARVTIEAAPLDVPTIWVGIDGMRAGTAGFWVQLPESPKPAAPER
jgi:hypothetical protein